MPRVKRGSTGRKRHKAILKAVSGHRASRHRRIRVAKESLLHALAYASAHRRTRKRERRALAITRINAAARLHGITYGQLVHGLKLSNVLLNRQVLAELAIAEPHAFSEVAMTAKSALTS